MAAPEIDESMSFDGLQAKIGKYRRCLRAEKIIVRLVMSRVDEYRVFWQMVVEIYNITQIGGYFTASSDSRNEELLLWCQLGGIDKGNILAAKSVSSVYPINLVLISHCSLQ